MWHDGLILNLESNGISENLLNFLKSYLRDRKQRGVLNDHLNLDWTGLDAGVPQGSVIGPCMFLVYINDLTDNISSNMKLFADDSTLFVRVTNVIRCAQKFERRYTDNNRMGLSVGNGF